MQRLKFFRVLLPVLLLLLAGVLLMEWTPPVGVHTPMQQDGEENLPRAVGVDFTFLKDGRPASAGTFDQLQQDEDGRLLVVGIHGLEIQRKGKSSLFVDATRGQGQGAQGESVWQFEDEVVVRDPEARMELRLPRFELDEVEGEGRSSGTIRLQGPGVDGTARQLVYRLGGQPTELTGPVLEDGRDGRMIAKRALLHDGLRDTELLGNVRVYRGQEQLNAEQMRVIRSEDGTPRNARGQGNVSAKWPSEVGPPSRLQSDSFDLKWDDAGEAAWLLLEGDAAVTRGREMFSARTIELDRRDGDGSQWKLHAEPDVYLEGRIGSDNGLLRAETIDAVLDRSFRLLSAEAAGRVIFESDDTRAESRRAEFVAGPDGGTIELFEVPPRKARLARQRMRVASDRIRTDPAGRDLLADGRVEAALLPADGQSTEKRGGVRLFAEDEAVHFVSDRLEGKESGSLLTFSGSVRGWQGERNLAAQTLTIDQRDGSLVAREQVTTRFPRESSGDRAAESDYIQISSDDLEYDDRKGLAVYSGSVRLVILEGWLESGRIDVVLDPQTRKISSVQAFGEVTMEFQPSDPEEGNKPMTATADRALYLPAERMLQLFGDQTPASARRLGNGGETTSGKVLRYRMDLGSFEVDSGEGTASIKTGGR